MGWDEWEQLKADALARRQNAMRLDSTAGTGASSAPDLKTNKAGKGAAVKALQGEIPQDTDKAGSHADESTSAAVRELSGWETGAGLKDAHAEWQLQVKNLKARLAQDQAALEGSHQYLQYVDYDVGSRTAQIDAGPHVPGRKV
ncbi:hypothetical protein [Streptomyces sp. NBC_00557]|uniref:hypothetical protein n=1 Tax=Streptomyces sp. NBC_00557 TaxID=2975776 RepID=UPI002E80BCC1|nr:hypothetical protein [Streptomyces sp. NBC_00557]WUC34998.1 hypothetical protein OG956_12605 [Streptomyces sp. NBC_00557]